VRHKERQREQRQVEGDHSTQRWHGYTHGHVAPAIAANEAGAATNPSAPVAAPTKTPYQHDAPRWGWRARREALEARETKPEVNPAAAPVPVAPTAGAPSAVLAQVADTDEMAKIREAVERLYADKMQGVREVQERANDSVSRGHLQCA
jgi:hypothetical protein